MGPIPWDHWLYSTGNRLIRERLLYNARFIYAYGSEGVSVLYTLLPTLLQFWPLFLEFLIGTLFTFAAWTLAMSTNVLCKVFSVSFFVKSLIQFRSSVVQTFCPTAWSDPLSFHALGSAIKCCPWGALITPYRGEIFLPVFDLSLRIFAFVAHLSLFSHSLLSERWTECFSSYSITNWWGLQLNDTKLLVEDKIRV